MPIFIRVYLEGGKYFETWWIHGNLDVPPDCQCMMMVSKESRHLNVKGIIVIYPSCCWVGGQNYANKNHLPRSAT